MRRPPAKVFAAELERAWDHARLTGNDVQDLERLMYLFKDYFRARAS